MRRDSFTNEKILFYWSSCLLQRETKTCSFPLKRKTRNLSSFPFKREIKQSKWSLFEESHSRYTRENCINAKFLTFLFIFFMFLFHVSMFSVFVCVFFLLRTGEINPRIIITLHFNVLSYFECFYFLGNYTLMKFRVLKESNVRFLKNIIPWHTEETNPSI